jgi:hypothetical protein
MVVFAAVALVAVSGCAPPKEELTPEDQIREAAFRDRFEKNSSALGEDAACYFLRVEGGADPSDDLLAKFEGHSPSVKPASSCTIEEATGAPIDPETGGRSLIFEVGAIEWESPDQVEVDVVYREGNQSAEGGVSTAVQVSGEWTVTKYVMVWKV